jgi:phosphoribosylaminoimidazole-succinocarboxamide synthase
MTDAKVEEISNRYIELYENVMGEKFLKTDYTNIEKDIETAVLQSLEKLN